MKRLIGIALALLLVAPALAQSPQIRQLLLKQQPPATAAAAYVGPVDINGTAVAWWGFRAASAAKRGSAIANVCNVTGGVQVGCADMLSDATTGALVPATISSITCPGTNCGVKILYDQSGATNCGGSACDMTQTTVANMPKLDGTSATGNTSACMKEVIGGSGTWMSNATGFSLATPQTVSVVQELTGHSGAGAFFLNSSQYYSQAASTWTIAFGGPTLDATATDSAFHADQLIAMSNGNGSHYIDGSLTSGTLGGTTTMTGRASINTNSTFNFGTTSGYTCEIGVWGADKTSNNSAMNTNQHNFWNF